MAFTFLESLSALFGWVYFLSWSLSFYPQLLLNWKRRSTSGTTIDFHIVNVEGFLAYLASNCAFYWSPVIRAQYAARNHGLTPTVALNDIAFAAHAFVLTSIIFTQYIPGLWGFAPSLSSTRPSKTIVGIALGCTVGVLAVVCVVWPSEARGGGADPAADWVWLDVIYAMGYVKLLITVVKYTPQILTNFRNRSTKGWSIFTILFDLVGGVLSIAQLCVDSYIQRDWSGITGNPVKLALGNVSIIYDIIFIVQHYILYRGAEGKAEERDALLENGDGVRHGRLD